MFEDRELFILPDRFTVSAWLDDGGWTFSFSVGSPASDGSKTWTPGEQVSQLSWGELSDALLGALSARLGYTYTDD